MKLISTKQIMLLDVGTDDEIEVVVYGNNEDGYKIEIHKEGKPFTVKMATADKPMNLKQLTSVGHFMEKIRVTKYTVIVK